MSTLPIVPRYGQVNLPLAERWAALNDNSDGPFLAINLMRYRERADYLDGRATDLTGREADDAYTPLGPLVTVGASFLLAADVERQPAGEPGFHRVAIVRYPTRRSFLHMQELDEFQELHVHKDAGMEFTIIVAAEPPERVAPGDPRGQLVVRLRRLAPGAEPADPEGVSEVVRLELEDVVVGDERRFDEVRIDRVLPEAIPALVETDGVEEQVVAVLATPMLDALALSARTGAGA